MNAVMDKRPTETLADDVATENYLGVENLIYGVCHKFIYKYLGRNYQWWDEIVAEGLLAYCVARRSHVKSKGKITTWVQIKVERQLLTWLRKRQLEQQRAFSELHENVPTYSRNFDKQAFYASLSIDARAVARLVLDTPTEIMQSVYALGMPSNKNLVAAITDWLIVTLKWNSKHVTQMFEEIRDALSVDEDVRNEAFNAGSDACLAGTPLRKNPYSASSTAWQYWREGWTHVNEYKPKRRRKA